MIISGATSLGFTTPSSNPAPAISSASRSAHFSSFLTCVDVKPSAVCSLKRAGRYSCKVALGSDSETSTLASGSTSTSPLSSSEEEKDAGAVAKVGARIRVKVPLKFYHVPKVPEVDVTGMEGVIKQYVSVWKGKRISANFPFKYPLTSNQNWERIQDVVKRDMRKSYHRVERLSEGLSLLGLTCWLVVQGSIWIFD